MTAKIRNMDMPEYKVWKNIKQRCLNRNCPAFRFYGGRGITMAVSWQTSFRTFAADMGPRPSAEHQIDRIDNDGPYSKDNCRWVDAKSNARNRRDNVLWALGRRTHTISEWESITGIDQATLWYRVSRGWSVERALTEPLHAEKRNRIARPTT
jgi:hypothetical protein